MKYSIADKTFYFIGSKHTEQFEKYPAIIPEAVKEFSEKYPLNKDSVRAIVYEPLKGPDHKVGFFYVGVLVADENSELPEGMTFLTLEGRYASVRDKFDVTKMGVLYNGLDHWIIQNNLKRKDVLEELMLELYYPGEDGTEEDLEIFMRVM